MSNTFETIPWPSLAPPVYPEYVVKEGWQRRQLLRVLRKPFSTIDRKVVIKPGRLSSKVVSQTYGVGNFTIVWTGDSVDSMGLEIRHNSNPNKTVWASIPGRSFVEGAALKLKILEERGSVEIDELFDATYTNQTVDTIQQKGDLLVLSGQLQADENADKNADRPSYTLSFYPSSTTEKALAFNLQITDSANTVSQARLLFQTSADEHFYGFGEQFSRVDCKGYEIPIVAEEGGIGRGDAGPRTLRLLG
ncbi:MAG: alpha-glucosidase, partial [Moorea sp. SIO3C2]|nr:alpha-glucosidase [Moorena sp. SIO3C2]